MGGSFLRLVHMLPVYLKQNMPRPVLGKSPAGVAAVAEELKDYAVLNYKSVIDSRGDADWSDDSNDGDRSKDDIDDPDAEVREAEQRRRRMRRRNYLYRKSWDEFLEVSACAFWNSFGSIGPTMSMCWCKTGASMYFDVQGC